MNAFLKFLIIVFFGLLFAYAGNLAFQSEFEFGQTIKDWLL